MSGRTLFLFDDEVARSWAPFAATRPVGELLLGSRSLRARAEEVLAAPCRGHLSGGDLEGWAEPGAPAAIRRDHTTGAGLRIYLSSRVALDWVQEAAVTAPTRLTLEGRVVGWAVAEGTPPPAPERLLRPDEPPGDAGASTESGVLDDLPATALTGTLLEGPWSLMAANPGWILRDGDRLWAEDASSGPAPPGIHRVGDHPLSLGDGAVVEPGVTVDTRDGPVRLEAGVRVEGPARLTGPLWIGEGSVVLGGAVGTSSIGPVCKVRGEVAESILLGWDNKAHDGHLGHAVLGEWVNLGAGTLNSDLKNTYGPVRVWTPTGPADTGLAKVGCFLGDHVKTAIGTLLPTGAVVGTGAHVFGDGGFTPTHIPSFAWGAEGRAATYRLEDFLRTAERAMARRDRTMSAGLRAVLSRAWERARAGRDG